MFLKSAEQQTAITLATQQSAISLAIQQTTNDPFTYIWFSRYMIQV